MIVKNIVFHCPHLLRKLINRRLIIRLLVLVLLIVVYYSHDWLFFRKLLRQEVAFILDSIGHRTAFIGSVSAVFLDVDSALYGISAECTYIRIFFMLAPFSWRFGLRLHINGLRLLMLAAAIWLADLVRVSLALHLDGLGLSWTLVHTIPDLLFQLVPQVIFTLKAMRSDWGN